MKKRQGSLERIRKLDFYAAPLAADAAAWRARCEELDGDAQRVSSEQGRQS
ncbi:hypothetical protein ACDA63_19200 [Uliginosibacterium sp. sgz301328]|uniref:hypothetical protein n=1 Tax=Uliginosibacterium sp. sgz301328 TaxID=3243764 RepID=UPI00359D3385